MKNDLISIEIATAKYPVHQNTIRNWCKSGKLQFQKAKRRKIVFSESEFCNLLTEHGFFIKLIGA